MVVQHNNFTIRTQIEHYIFNVKSVTKPNSQILNWKMALEPQAAHTHVGGNPILTSQLVEQQEVGSQAFCLQANNEAGVSSFFHDVGLLGRHHHAVMPWNVMTRRPLFHQCQRKPTSITVITFLHFEFQK